MPVLDLEAALSPVSDDEPCGPDLQYDEAFISLETASQGKPEQQYGDTIIPAEEPKWREMKELALELLVRTKDLRVAGHLARASLVIDGVAAFGECLELIAGYLERYWPTVHPLLDPDDDNDPTERVNTIASLADPASTIRRLLDAPIVQSQRCGSFRYQDVMIARGEASAPDEDSQPDMAGIEAAFLDCDFESLQHLATALAAAHEHAVLVEAKVTAIVGAENATSMEKLSGTLEKIRDYVHERVAARAGVEDVAEAPTDAFGEPLTDASSGPADTAAATPPPALAGEVRTREDVIRALDKICDYYDRYEPSSPLPLLLKRAKRLATKSFMDILEDLIPDGLSQARMISGEGDSSDDD
ncbi:MAG: type VI secretion system protein TssA [Planctomycetota bacterium]